MGSHSIQGNPDRYLRAQPIQAGISGGMADDLIAVYLELLKGVKIGVHHRAARNRYSILGKPITRRTIDRLVYFGVIDEGELQNDQG